MQEILNATKDFLKNTLSNNILTNIIGAFIGAILFHLFLFLIRPKLDIKFEANDTYTPAPSKSWDKNMRDILFIHVNVINKSKTLAQKCKVFLLKLEKKNGNQFKEIPIKAHLTLKWANESIEKKGFNGLEIPGKYRRRVDLIRAPNEKRQYFKLFIEEDEPRGISNCFNEGEYRFTIQASGLNTNTVTKRFILKWQGTFEKNNIHVYEEK